MKAATPFLALILLTGCATVPPAQAEGPVGLGQTAYANGLRVRPISIIEDSRCPAKVQCVWAGRLVIRTEVIGGGWRKIFDLELGKPQHVADGALTLIAVHPEKIAEAKTDPRAYRFTFDFQGGL